MELAMEQFLSLIPHIALLYMFQLGMSIVLFFLMES